MFDNTNTTPSASLLHKTASLDGTYASDVLAPNAGHTAVDGVGFSDVSQQDIDAMTKALSAQPTAIGPSLMTTQTVSGVMSQSSAQLSQTIDPLLGHTLAVGSLTTITTATDPNGTRATAIDVGDLTSDITRSGSIGYDESYGIDERDYYEFSVTEARKVDLELTGLSENAGLALYNDAGKLLTWSNKGSNNSESISRWLGTGDYYALVYSEGSWGGETSYTLSLDPGQTLDNLLDDYSVTNDVASKLQDGYIDRADMISILRSAKDYSSVNSYEINDFRDILNDYKAFGIEGYVENLADKVVNGNAANGNYQGSSLGNLYAGASDSHMEKLVSKHFYGSDRPDVDSGYSYRYASGSLFQNGISHTDVDQGAEGDCYFLASLGAAAHQKSEFINDMFIDNGDNTFTVRFFNNGQEDYVTVDRYLPFSSSGYFVYANNSSGKKYNDTSNELWVALAEKAYAQVNEANWINQNGQNSYDGIAYGWPKNAMEHITGLDTAQDSIVNTFLWITVGDNISDIISAYNSDQLVALNTKASGVDSGIVANHSYVMTGYNAFTQEFELYNPWGGSGSTIHLSHQQVKDNFQNWDYTTT